MVGVYEAWYYGLDQGNKMNCCMLYPNVLISRYVMLLEVAIVEE